jgi:hypothetical protein
MFVSEKIFRCLGIGRRTTPMPVMTKEQRSRLEAAVLADIQESNTNYFTIASRRHCSVSFVNAVVKRHGITRIRGVKPKSTPAGEV